MDARRNVLICEDDPVQLRVLTAAFMQAGFRALGARSPAEAVRKLDREAVDAVVSDVQLEGGSAFDVLGGARRSGLDAPVFMMSAYATPNLRERVRASGVVRFFEKPCPVPEIVRTVGEALEAVGPGMRVLVVEDHGPARSAVSGILTRAGYETLVAEDGARALEALGAVERPVDLVVMDLNVPGPSGAELVRRIREIAGGAPVIMLSGDATHREIAAAYAAGATSLLRKPFGEESLLRFVRAHATLARKARAAERLEAGRPRRSWISRLVRAVRRFLRGPRAAAAGLAMAAILAGAALAMGLTERARLEDAMRSSGPPADLEAIRLQRQMVDQMRRFSDGYQQELRWYGISPR